MNLFEVGILGMQVGALVMSLWRGQNMRALYWFGALLLTIAVVRGLK